jgi:3-methyl-2-oxobutanoate hydroxymethyltransferase
MSVAKIVKMKGKQKIVMLTAYDRPTAAILEACGVDMILVGDSLGTAVMGYSTTVPVTMEECIHHCRAVRNGAPESIVVADMPFLSYGVSVEEGVRNAGRLLKETGANAVKLEGGKVFAESVKRMTDIGIPVMGHIGLKPQSENLVGHRVAGRTDRETEDLVEDARALEAAGVFSIVLEGTVEEAAKAVTESVSVPTIGIGAGRFTDGQVLVVTDMLGFDPKANFRHNRRYADLHSVISGAVKAYADDVRKGSFPGEENLFRRE